MNYSSLSSAIQNYPETAETAFVANIDLFIELAERSIYRMVDLNVARKYATTSLTIDDPFLTLPSDCIVIRSLHTINPSTDARTFLIQKDPSFIDDYSADRTVTGTPRYYAHHNETTIIIVPATDAALNVELAYTRLPAQISSGNTTTWLGDNAPDALLYGCLLEAARFLKEEQDILQMYEKRFMEAIQGLVMEENLRNRSDVYREREIKMPTAGAK